MSTPVGIRDIDLSDGCDLSAVVAIHREAFTGFFLTLLGPRFVGTYYRTVALYPRSVFRVAEHSDRVVGFLVGFIDPPACYQHLKRNWWQFVGPLAIAVATRPALLRRILQSILRVGMSGKNIDRKEIPASTIAELASIAVSPRNNGRGTGELLVRDFLALAQRSGARIVFLTTDRDSNERVVRFYRKLGFSLVREFPRGRGRTMLEFRYDLPQESWDADSRPHT